MKNYSNAQIVPHVSSSFMYLLDTNIISELSRKNPASSVIHFIKQAKNNDTPLYLSALTLGEINKGIVQLEKYGDHVQSNKLKQWLEKIKKEYSNYILSIDTEVAELWGAIIALTDNTNAIDKLIAATGLIYDLTIVTRNEQHIMFTGAKYFNPYKHH